MIFGPNILEGPGDARSADLRSREATVDCILERAFSDLPECFSRCVPSGSPDLTATLAGVMERYCSPKRLSKAVSSLTQGKGLAKIVGTEFDDGADEPGGELLNVDDVSVHEVVNRGIAI